MNQRILVISFMFFVIVPFGLQLKPHFHMSSSAEQTINIINDTPETMDHYYRYLVASYQHAQGKALQSLASYNHLFKLNPSPYAYNDFFQLLFNSGQYQKIITLYESKHELFSSIFNDNTSVQLSLAQSYLICNQEQKAEKIFKNLALQHPDDAQIAYFTGLAYVQSNQSEKALAFINSCLKNPALKQKYFLFYFLNSKAYALKNKYTQALESIETSLKLFPKFDHGLLLKAMLLEQMGKINDAIKGYQHFLDLVGRDTMVEKQLAQLLFTQQRFTEAEVYLKRLNNNNHEYLFNLALMEFKKGRDKQALAHIDKALAIAPHFTQANLLKIEILLQNKKISQLLSFMEQWVGNNYNNLSAMSTLLLLRNVGVSTDSLIKVLQRIASKISHEHIFAAIADLYVENKNYQKAIAYYKKVITTTTDASLQSKTLFQIGYLHFVTNQTQELENALNKAIAINPAHPSAFNLLAYHYARSNKNLQQALQLCEKALAAAPECYYYLDTKGYILYKLDRHQEAVAQFEKALELAPGNKVIQQHLYLATKSGNN